MSEFLFKRGEEVHCEGFGYGQVSGLVHVGYAPRIVVDFDEGEAHCFTPDGYFEDPEEVKKGGYNPRLQSVNHQEDTTTSTDTLTLQPGGSVMEVVSYRKQLVRDIAAVSLSGPNVAGINDDAFAELFAKGVVYLADTIIKELEKA